LNLALRGNDLPVFPVCPRERSEGVVEMHFEPRWARGARREEERESNHPINSVILLQEITSALLLFWLALPPYTTQGLAAEFPASFV
jgi:hypothetical protein